ncbi:ABC transporter permease [Gaopeijia maritima]|uniref:ABC transporter permease n=1 Tax=Gaopeijia maritima TaxID=3119007 RepID=UPI003255C16C
MSWARRLVRICVGGEARDVVEGDLDERLRADLEAGFDEREAGRRDRRRALGSIVAVWRDRMIPRGPGAGRGGGMAMWTTTVRAARGVARRPRFAVAVVGTLGLGLGAATAVFSVVDGVLLRPLDLPEPHELVAIWMTQEGETTNLSAPNAMDLRSGVEAFDAMVLYSGGSASVTGSDGRIRTTEAVRVTDQLTRVLGRAPLLGRDFRPDDLRPGAPATAVITHGFWTEAFGADPAVVGRTIDLDGVPTEVVGVLAAGVAFPLAPDARLMLPMADEGIFRERDLIWLGAVARLRADVDPAAARAEVEGVWEGLRSEHPRALLDHGVAVLPLQRYLVADLRGSLWLLMGATGLLLAMACLSVGGLLLARGRSRAGELSLRAALGAGRRAIVGEMVIEGLLLTVGAAALGAVLAAGLVRALRTVGPADLVPLQQVSVDGRVLAVSAVAALLVGLATTAWPALRSVRAAPAARLMLGGRGGVGERGARAGRFATVGAQVALATVLLAGATLLGRSFLSLVQVDPGYRIDGVITARVEMAPAAWESAEARRALLRDAADRLRAEPGVEEVGWTLLRPLDDSRINYDVAIDGEPAVAAEQGPSADLQLATSGYFRALEIPLLEGRLFEDRDVDGPPVALVTAALARDLWGDASPVGRRIGWVVTEAEGPRWHEVIGVVADVRQQSLDAPEHGTMILDLMQRPQYGATLTVRASRDLGPIAEAMRREVPQLGPGIAELEVTTLRDARSADVAPQRFLALLLASFSVVAVILAAVGTCATLAWTMSRRRREVGVRLALGADPSRVRREVIREGMQPVVAGLLVGAAGALMAAGTVRGLLFEVPARDPWSLTLTLVTLAGVGLLACLIPAVRASRADPAWSLRE